MVDVVQGRETIRNVAPFLPDLSVSMSLFKGQVSAGSKYKASLSLGPSVAAKVRLGDAVIGWYDDSVTKSDADARYAVALSNDEIDFVARTLASIDLVNAGALSNGFPIVYSDTLQAEMGPVGALRESLDGFPSFSPNLEAQIELMEPGQAAQFQESDMVKRYLALSATDKAQFDDPTTSEEDRRRLVGVTGEQIKEAVVQVLGGQLASSLTDDLIAGRPGDILTRAQLGNNRIDVVRDRYDNLIAALEEQIAAETDATERGLLEKKLGRIVADRDQTLNRMEFGDFKSDVDYIDGEIQGAAAIIGIFDSDLGRDVSKKGTAIANIAMAIGRMYYGEISFSSVGQLASGLQALFQDTKPTGDQVIIGALGQVIENQKLIIRKLDIISLRLGVLEIQIADLFDIIESHNAFTTASLEAISRDLDEILTTVIYEANTDRFSEVTSIEDELLAKHRRIEEIFDDPWQAADKIALRTYITAGFVGAPPAIWRQYDGWRKDISDAVISTSYTNNFVRRSGVVSEILDYETFLSAMNVPPEFRAGYLDSTLRHAEIAGPTGMPNPRFASLYASSYIRQALYLDRVPSADRRLQQVCSVGTQIISSQDQLNEVVHKVREVSANHAGEAQTAYSSAFETAFEAYFRQLYRQAMLSLVGGKSSWPDPRSNLKHQNDALKGMSIIGTASHILDGAYSSISDTDISNAVVGPDKSAEYAKFHYRIRRLAFIYDTLDSEFGNPHSLADLEEIITKRIDALTVEEVIQVLGPVLNTLRTHDSSEFLGAASGRFRVSIKITPSRDIFLWSDRFFLDAEKAFLGASQLLGKTHTAASLKATWERTPGPLYRTHEVQQSDRNTRLNVQFHSSSQTNEVIAITKAFAKQAVLQELRAMNSSNRFRALMLGARDIKADLVTTLRYAYSLDTISGLSSSECRVGYDSVAGFDTTNPGNYAFVKSALDNLEVPSKITNPTDFIVELSKSYSPIANGLLIDNDEGREKAMSCGAKPALSEALIDNMVYVETHRPDLTGGEICLGR